MGYQLTTHEIKEGAIYDDGTVRVEARTTQHLGMTEAGVPLSWAFRIKCSEKTIVYSGDFRHLSDIGNWFDEADLFLLENAHVKAADICRELRRRKSNVGRLVFLHHGLETLYSTDYVIKEVREIAPEAEFAKDGMTMEI